MRENTVEKLIKENIEGQLELDMCLITSHPVRQAHDLIIGKQTLTLNAAKFVRLAIMQIEPTDRELNKYYISCHDFSNALGTNKTNVYRDAKRICREITHTTVEILITDGEHEHWESYPWAASCGYDTKSKKIFIKLNSDLKPYLLSMKERLTQEKLSQYPYDHVAPMRTITGLRLFEMIQDKCELSNQSIQNATVIFSVAQLRKTYDCENKYPSYTQFYNKIIKAAISDIEETMKFQIDLKTYKSGRSISKIELTIKK